MKIKLTTSRVCGLRGENHAGDVIEVSNEEAAHLIRSGSAEPIAHADPVTGSVDTPSDQLPPPPKPSIATAERAVVPQARTTRR